MDEQIIVAPGEVPAGFEVMPEGLGFTNHVGPVYWGERGDQFVLGFRVLDKHSNPAQICHGGMLMTVMDMGLGIGIANFIDKAGFSPTMSLSVDFLAPARVGDWIESRAHFAHATRSRCTVHGVMIGPDGPVLRANGTFKMPRENDTRFKTDTLMLPELIRARRAARQS